jgi:hypothetical protein
MNFNSPHWLQSLLPLTQTTVTERGHSLVCIPDRDAAESELAKLRREYRKRLIRAAIRKDKPGKSSTYTLRYFTRDVETVALF